MTDILRLFFMLLLLSISLSAYFLVIAAMFPERVKTTQQAIDQMPWRSFGVGLVNFLFFGVILLVLFTITDGNANRVNSAVRVILLVPTLALTALLIAAISLGLTGMVNVLGDRIFPEFNLLKRNTLSALTLSLACALPFVGWFLLLPYLALTGFGATILGFFQRATS